MGHLDWSLNFSNGARERKGRTMDIISRISDLAAPGAEAAGLVLDSVSVNSAGKRTTVVIAVDLPEDQVGSASIDAIAAASRAIGAALDDANVPAGAYTLEVSTPGAERPLTDRRHFMRARTRTIAAELADGTSVTGRLDHVSEDHAVLTIDGDQREIPLANVTTARVVLDFG
jgi:ribosome maturation factor RimP